MAIFPNNDIEHDIESLDRLSFESRVISILRKMNNRIKNLENKNNNDQEEEEGSPNEVSPQMLFRSAPPFALGGGPDMLSALLAQQMGCQRVEVSPENID